MSKKSSVLIASLLMTAAPAAYAADPPSQQQLWEIIQKQQRQIESLKAKVEGTATEMQQTRQSVRQTEQAVEAATAAAKETATAGSGWWDRTSVGGYGELHYNGGDADELDFHRFVLNVDHRFNDRIRLFTELELEHALTEDTDDGSGPGEVELEQAWVEFDFDERAQAQGRAGLFMIPVGILNETHEPPTFFGVERNRVETNIIPTSWWEGGAGLNYKFDNGIRIDGQMHGGLDVPTSGNNAFRIRNGRQKVAESTFRDPAFTGRVKWTGMPGVELASTFQYQTDITQSDAADPATGATLWEVHADLTHALSDRIKLGFRGLYARWDLFGSAAEAVGRDEQYGWYVEPSVRFDTRAGEFGLFARYSEDDNTAGDDTESLFGQVSVGANYWPHQNVVLKLDYEIQQPPEGTERDDRVNAGIGFQF